MIQGRTKQVIDKSTNETQDATVFEAFALQETNSSLVRYIFPSSPFSTSFGGRVSSMCMLLVYAQKIIYFNDHLSSFCSDQLSHMVTKSRPFDSYNMTRIIFTVFGLNSTDSIHIMGHRW